MDHTIYCNALRIIPSTTTGYGCLLSCSGYRYRSGAAHWAVKPWSRARTVSRLWMFGLTVLPGRSGTVETSGHPALRHISMLQTAASLIHGANGFVRERVIYYHGDVKLRSAWWGDPCPHVGGGGKPNNVGDKPVQPAALNVICSQQQGESQCRFPRLFPPLDGRSTLITERTACQNKPIQPELGA